MIDEKFPKLNQFFGAYLNLDFPEEYKTADAAAADFVSLMDGEHRSKVRAEIDALIVAFPEPTSLIDAMTELGSGYWLDPKKDDPVAFLTHLSGIFASAPRRL